MLLTFGTLLLCQLVGEVTVRSFDLPIPGPVLGLVLLLLVLSLRPAFIERLRPTVTIILANLSLLFVPAGVGVIGNLEVLSNDWLPLLFILVVSTWLSMLVAVATFLGIRRLTERSST